MYQINEMNTYGFYILDAAEPLPVITDEELEFERFQTAACITLELELEAIMNGNTSQDIDKLASDIVNNYGSLTKRITFIQNIRNNDDNVYKHCLNVAMLCAMISCKMGMDRKEQYNLVLAAFYHDSIEDARLSYNDVMKIARSQMDEEQAYLAAEIVYALTNEKGRNRAERANEKYFAGIREIPYAPFVKLADRLANTSYAFSKGTADSLRMSKVYREELPGFLEALKVEGTDVRFLLPEAMVEDLWEVIPQCGSENYV